MASTGVIAEFGKKPPAVKVAIFVAIGLVLAGLYWQLVYSKLRKDIQAEEANATALADDEKKLQKDEKEYKDLKAKQDALEALIKENDSALPTAAQLPAFFDMLNRKVGEASVEVRRWERLSEVQVDDQIFKVPVQIELQGSFYELKKFFYLLYKMNQNERDEPAEPSTDPTAVPAEEIEERDRILTIEDLRIGDPQVKNNELTLVATFRASTFRKEEPEPAAVPADDKKKDTKKDAKDPKPPKAGDAKTPPPSGQTGIPARSKEKVEGAMEKSEQRVEKSPGGADAVKGGM
jgi:Tfp pilus assembly protein PilO